MRGEPWWSISGEDLLMMLRRVEAGESPEMVYAEQFANSDIEEILTEKDDQ